MERSQYPSTVCGLHGPMLSSARGRVVGNDEGSRIDRERPEDVDAAANPRAAVGLVRVHQRIRQCQRRAGVIVSPAAQAGAADPPFAWFRIRMLEDTVVVAESTLAMPPPSPLPPPPPWAWLRSSDAVADGDRAGRELAIAGGVVIPQEVEDAAPRARGRRRQPRAAGRVVVAARGLAVVQHAAADAGGASRVVRDAGAGPGADKARHAGGAAVVVAALGTCSA